MPARAAAERLAAGLRAAGHGPRRCPWRIRVRRVPAGGSVRLVVVAGLGQAGRRGRRQRQRRSRAGQGVGEHRRGAERRAVAVRPLEQRPAGHVVDAGRHARGHLARRARTPVVLRRGREQPGRGPRGPLVAGPVAGQRGVKQPGEVPRVDELRVIGAVLRRGQGSGRARQGGVDAEPGDLHAAARCPVQAGRIQPQVRQAAIVRVRDRPRRLRHQGGRTRRIERTFGEHVEQRLPDHPLEHHVGELVRVLHVEYLGKARIAEPARGPGGGDGLGHPGETSREGEHGNRAGERLVRGFPVCPAGARAYLVDETISSRQPGTWFRRVCAHRLPPMLMPPALPAEPRGYRLRQVSELGYVQ